MSDRRVASRYAKSLIELAEEKGVLEEVNRDMQLFASVCDENRDFVLAIRNPIIQNDKKLAILKKVFNKQVSDMVMRFFEIISRKNREVFLPDIAEEFHRQYNIHKGIVRAEVVTTFPLDDAMRLRFKELVKDYFKDAKAVELQEKVDESLIGGFVLTVGDRQIDESLSSKFNKLKLEFSRKHKTFVKEI